MTVRNFTTRRDYSPSRKLALSALIAGSLIEGCIFHPGIEMPSTVKIEPKPPEMVPATGPTGTDARKVPASFEDAMRAVKDQGFEPQKADPVYVQIAYNIVKGNDAEVAKYASNPDLSTPDNRAAIGAAFSYSVQKGNLAVLDSWLTSTRSIVVGIAKEEAKNLPATSTAMDYVLNSPVLRDTVQAIFAEFYRKDQTATSGYLSSIVSTTDSKDLLLPALRLLVRLNPEAATTALVSGLTATGASQNLRVETLAIMRREEFNPLDTGRAKVAEKIPLNSEVGVKAYGCVAAAGQVQPLIPLLRGKDNVLLALDSIFELVDPKANNKELIDILRPTSKKHKNEDIRGRAKDILAKLNIK